MKEGSTGNVPSTGALEAAPGQPTVVQPLQDAGDEEGRLLEEQQLGLQQEPEHIATSPVQDGNQEQQHGAQPQQEGARTHHEELCLGRRGSKLAEPPSKVHSSSGVSCYSHGKLVQQEGGQGE